MALIIPSRNKTEEKDQNNPFFQPIGSTLNENIKKDSGLNAGNLIIPERKTSISTPAVLEAPTKVGFSEFVQELPAATGRTFLNIGTGQLQAVKGLSSFGEMLGVEELAPVTNTLNNWIKEVEDKNPSLASQIQQGIGSMTTFMLPGSGVSKGVTALSKAVPILSKVASTLGAGVMTLLEAGTEAGEVYDQSIKSGQSKEEAKERGEFTFYSNVALLYITNKLAYFDDVIKINKATDLIKKMIFSSQMEGVQEFGQQVFSNIANDRPIDEGVKESYIIGAILGFFSGGMDTGVVRPNITEEIASKKATEAGQAEPAKFNIPERNNRIYHGTKASIEQIQKEGFKFGQNSSFGEAAFFTDNNNIKNIFGENTLELNSDNFNFKALESIQAEQEYIQKNNAVNLAGAVRNEGIFDGFIIPNKDKSVGNTYGITNKEKLNDIISISASKTDGASLVKDSGYGSSHIKSLKREINEMQKRFNKETDVRERKKILKGMESAKDTLNKIRERKNQIEMIQDAPSNYYEAIQETGRIDDSAKGKSIKSPIKLKFKKNGSFIFANEKISSPADVAYAFKQLKNEAVEHFYAVGLKNKIPTTVELISMGTLNASLVHPREVTSLLTAKGVDEVYYIHNHPSGSIEPSEADLQLTDRLKDIHKELGIEYGGHVIIDTDKFGFIGKNGLFDFQKIDHKKAAENPKNVSSYKKYIEWVNDNADNITINKAMDVFEIYKGMTIGDKDLLVFFLDTRNNIITTQVMKKKATPADILKHALKYPTAGIMIAGQELGDSLSGYDKNFDKYGISLIDIVEADLKTGSFVRDSRGNFTDKGWSNMVEDKSTTITDDIAKAKAEGKSFEEWAKVESIKERGLLAPKGWEGSGTINGVYAFTDKETPMSIAKEAGFNEIVSFKIPKNKFSKVVVDEDMGVGSGIKAFDEGSIAFEGNIPPKWITEIMTADGKILYKNKVDFEGKEVYHYSQFDKTPAKTKSQLKQLWDKAGTDDIASSISKAKARGKSFEEWVKTQGEQVYHGSNKKIKLVDEIDFSEGFYTLKRTADDVTDQIKYLNNPYNNKITKLSRIKEEKLLTQKEIKEWEGLLENPSESKKLDKRFDELAQKAGEQARINSGLTIEKELENYLKDPALAFGENVNEFIVKFKNPLIVDFNGKGWMAKDNFLYDSTSKEIAKAIKNGNDGIIIKNINEGFSAEGIRGSSAGLVDDYIVLDKSAIKTKSQLKQLWDEAGTKVDNITDDIAKAKAEGKSFEEFWGEQDVVYHGTPNKFDDFSYDFIGSQGTAEGKGFYFTNKKDIAKGYYKKGGQLIEAKIEINKPLSLEKKNITKDDLKKFIDEYDKSERAMFDGEGGGYLDDVGSIEFEGREGILNKAVDLEFDNVDNDVDMIHSIANASGGDFQHIYDVLNKTLGYDGIIAKNPEWGKGQTITVAFFPDQIKTKSQLKQLWDKTGGITDDIAKAKAVMDKPLLGKEQLEQREEAKKKRLDEIFERDQLAFYDEELENQYQSFKKLITPAKLDEVEDVDQLKEKVKAKPEEIDNILYSQDKSADEIFYMFKERRFAEQVPLTKVPKETKAIVRYKAQQQIKSAKEILDRRRGFIKEVQKQFGLSDNDLKKITKRDIRLMENYEFKQFLDDIKIKALQFAETRQKKNEVLSTIKELNLKKFENLRKAMKLPPLNKMTNKQLDEYNKALSKAQYGDIFLTQRQIETVKNTDLAGIKTIREAKEALAEELNIPVLELDNIKVSELDRLRFDTALADKNPFYKMLVEKTHAYLLGAEKDYLEIEEKINELAIKARKSVKRKLVNKLIPTDDLVFDYLSGKDLGRKLTEEEMELAGYLQMKFADALDYLIKMEELKEGKEDYITNIRRGFLEALKIDGIGKAIKEVFDKQKQDLQTFEILDSETGDILPLEKFFQFSLKRKDGIEPTKNVAKAASIYFKTLETKKALDGIMPKMMIYVDSLTPQRLTPKGLEMDRSLKKFVTEWINNKKGRKTKLIAKQGGKIDIALNTIRSFLYFKDLGLSLPVGLASMVGEQVATFVNIGNKQYLKGIARSKTKQGKAILNNYKEFIGKNIWEELIEPSKNIGDKFSEGMFSLFHQSTVEANKIHLLGVISKEEFESGELSPERLAEIKLEVGKFRMLSQGKSIIGSTAEGQILTQYKTWAIPILRTVLKDFGSVSKGIINGNFKKTFTSKELKELLRAAEISTAVIFLGSMLIDEDDDSFLGQLTKKLYREALTIMGSLDTKTMLAAPRLVSFVENVGEAISNIIKLEEYKTKDGYIGIEQLKREIKPSFIRQFQPNKEEKKSRTISGRKSLDDIFGSGSMESRKGLDQIFK